MANLNKEQNQLMDEFFDVCDNKANTTPCLEFLQANRHKLSGAVMQIYQTDISPPDRCSEMGPCQGSTVGQWLLGYNFPIISLLCIVCNGANIAVYNVGYLRRSMTVKLLATKALANTLFVICCSPAYLALIPALRDTTKASAFYWSTWVYTLFLANTFGTIAAWITVFLMLERYAYVAFPFSAKSWFTWKRVYLVVFITSAASVLLHMVYPITRYVLRIDCGNGSHQYKTDIKPQKIYHTYERIYHLINTVLALILPTALMVIVSFCLWYQFVVQKRILNSERKKCLTRLTVATTLAQLTLETPQSILFVSVGLYGMEKILRQRYHCIIRDVTNFLSVLNASVSFLIYLICSGKFRQLFVNRVRGNQRATGEASISAATTINQGVCRALDSTSRINCSSNQSSGHGRRRFSKPDGRRMIRNRLSVPFLQYQHSSGSSILDDRRNISISENYV